ncbi:MAG: allene oxide cyclase barrel-like domain-containing protein [Sporichthyaceae bacterium]
MEELVRSTLAAAAAASLLGAVAFAAHAHADTAATRIAAVEKLQSFVVGEEGAKGLSLGDSFTFSSRLHDTDGRRIGSAGGECATLRVVADEVARAHCVATYRLRGGEFMAQGFYDGRVGARGQLAVLGGTGRYAGATGILRYHVRAADTFELAFRLRG